MQMTVVHTAPQIILRVLTPCLLPLFYICFVAQIRKVKLAAPSGRPMIALPTARAIRAFRASTSEELSFNKGDIITLLQCDQEKEW